MTDRKRNDVDNFEQTAEYKKSESSQAHRDPKAYPSSDAETPATDVPDRNQTASDGDAPPRQLHGSLHGQWEGTEDTD